MDEKKLKKFLIIFILALMILFNKKIMPVRKEITELVLTKVIGMDSIDEGKYKVQQTIARINYDDKSSGSSSGWASGSQPQQQLSKAFSVEGETFSDIIRSFQTYTEKSLTGSHIRYFLIGENMFKKENSLKLDFNIRDYEVRSNASVYIIKGNTAEEFVKTVQTETYDIDEKMSSMEKNNEAKSVSDKVNVIQLIDILINKERGSLVPTIKIISDSSDEEEDDKSTENVGEKQKEEEQVEAKNEQEFFPSAFIEPTKSQETFYDFGGFAILKNNEIIGYLDRSESITANIIRNKFKGTNINIDFDNKILSFGILTCKTNFKFEFEKNVLKKVIIETKFQSNFDEVPIASDVFKEGPVEELEKAQEQKMKDAIKKVIEEVLKYKCDFLGIKKIAEFQHPYKMKKIKNFDEQLLSAEFEVKTVCNIDRTYDILSLGGSGEE